ncbi:hypothetical protein GYH30_039987 [Glycine max]|uniref:Uncharacterized protein n=1 Tax=Glycine max TaxID=3847 RepID=K7M6T9_SOYBN|nr:hypothetical protein GYH30_039987 [Glycine max]
MMKDNKVYLCTKHSRDLYYSCQSGVLIISSVIAYELVRKNGDDLLDITIYFNSGVGSDRVSTLVQSDNLSSRTKRERGFLQ